MFKQLTTLLLMSVVMSVLIACGQAPITDLTALDNSKNQRPLYFCLTSQSECRINTVKGGVKVSFSQQSFIASTDNLSAQASIQTRDYIGTELPFAIIVEPLNKSDATITVSKISGYIEGKDMFMGKIPLLFTKEVQDKEFIALSSLGSCAEDIMVWRLWLTFKFTDNQESTETVFIDFKSLRS